MEYASGRLNLMADLDDEPDIFKKPDPIQSIQPKRDPLDSDSFGKEPSIQKAPSVKKSDTNSGNNFFGDDSIDLDQSNPIQSNSVKAESETKV